MLEYVFFQETPFQSFVKDLEVKKISPSIRIDEDNYQIYEIAIPEDINDDLLDEIDEKYDELFSSSWKPF